MPTMALGLQTAQRRSYLHTLGPKVGSTYILGALGWASKPLTQGLDSVGSPGLASESSPWAANGRLAPRYGDLPAHGWVGLLRNMGAVYDTNYQHPWKFFKYHQIRTIGF